MSDSSYNGSNRTRNKDIRSMNPSSWSVDPKGNVYAEGDDGYNPIYMGHPSERDFSDRLVPMSKPSRAIIKDIENADIPFEVKCRAMEIYGKVQGPMRKGRKRKNLIAFCIFSAYTDLEIAQDPRVIAKKIGIKPRRINKALSIGMELEDVYVPNNKFFTPLDFVPVYFELLNLPSLGLKDIISLTSSLMEKSREMIELPPQNAAMGIVLHYMLTRGFAIDMKEISERFDRSEMTLRSIMKTVADIDNN